MSSLVLLEQNSGQNNGSTNKPKASLLKGVCLCDGLPCSCATELWELEEAAVCPSLLPVPPLFSLTAPEKLGQWARGRERTGGKGVEARSSVCRRDGREECEECVF